MLRLYALTSFSCALSSCRFVTSGRAPAYFLSLVLLVLVRFLVLDSHPKTVNAATIQDSEKAFDVVEYQRDAVSPRQVLSGYIQDLNRKELTIDLGTNGRRTIDCNQILSVRLNANPAVVVARQLSLSGKFSEAADAWEGVIRNQKEKWLQRYAAMQRCQCQQAAGQTVAAISSFMALAENDPTEVPWAAAPLVWGNASNDQILQQQLGTWLKGKDPVQLVVAASQGLQSARVAHESREVLQKAAAASDPQIAAIAKMQLWRLENSVNENRLIEWNDELNSMPPELRGGGLLVLGRLKKGLGKEQEAVADFLRVATLYPDQHALVLLGLDQAYLTLKGMQDPQAETVGRWLKQRFPESAAASAIGRE